MVNPYGTTQNDEVEPLSPVLPAAEGAIKRVRVCSLVL